MMNLKVLVLYQGFVTTMVLICESCNYLCAKIHLQMESIESSKFTNDWILTAIFPF